MIESVFAGLLGLSAPGVLEAVGSIAAATDGDGTAWLLLAGPVSGVLIYVWLYRYYRNVDKSHSYERDTLIESQPITGSDSKVSEVRGTKQTSIHGNNVHNHRQRVRRG